MILAFLLPLNFLLSSWNLSTRQKHGAHSILTILTMWPYAMTHNFFSAFSFIIIICSQTGSISYKAQSQDEDALVQAAARLHMAFFNKNANILGRSCLLLAVI